MRMVTVVPCEVRNPIHVNLEPSFNLKKTNILVEFTKVQFQPRSPQNNGV